MKRMMVRVGAFLLPALWLMTSAAPLMAQTSSTQNPSQSQQGGFTIPKNLPKQPVNPRPATGYPPQSTPAGVQPYKPASQQMPPANSTYVVKQNQSSPARTSCLANCQTTQRKQQAGCDKERDPVMKAYCLKPANAAYNQCASKCPAK